MDRVVFNVKRDIILIMDFEANDLMPAYPVHIKRTVPNVWLMQISNPDFEFAIVASFMTMSRQPVLNQVVHAHRCFLIMSCVIRNETVRSVSSTIECE
jgi:hypothetical protein